MVIEVWKFVLRVVSFGSVFNMVFFDVIMFFDGKSISEWIYGDGFDVKWEMGDGFMIVVKGVGGIKIKRNFGDC